MKTIKKDVKVDVNNTFSPLPDTYDTVESNFYTLLGLLYRKGAAASGMGFSTRGRIRNVKAHLHEGFIKKLFESGHTKEMVANHVVEIPVKKSLAVTFDLEIPVTVPSGDYTLRVLQIPTDPETLSPLVDIPDFDNAQEPTQRQKLETILQVLKDPFQTIITEYSEEVKLKNKALDKHLKSIEEKIKFFNDVFVKQMQFQPKKVIEQLLFDIRGLRLGDLDDLWLEVNQLYRTIQPDAALQQQRQSMEKNYEYIKSITVQVAKMREQMRAVNKFIFTGHELTAEPFEKHKKEIIDIVWIEYTGHVVEIITFAKKVLDMFKQSLGQGDTAETDLVAAA